MLVEYVSGLDMYLLVDGHDRLRAALLEGASPPVLVLSRVRAHAARTDPERQAAILRELERKRRLGGERSTDAQNRLLVTVFDDRDALWPKTRAWPLEGGRARWEAEVLAEGIVRSHPLLTGARPAR